MYCSGSFFSFECLSLWRQIRRLIHNIRLFTSVLAFPFNRFRPIHKTIFPPLNGVSSPHFHWTSRVHILNSLFSSIFISISRSIVTQKSSGSWLLLISYISYNSTAPNTFYSAFLNHILFTLVKDNVSDPYNIISHIQYIFALSFYLSWSQSGLQCNIVLNYIIIVICSLHWQDSSYKN